MSEDDLKRFITKLRPGDMIKSDGPVTFIIKEINSFGQIELLFILEKDVFISKAE